MPQDLKRELKKRDDHDEDCESDDDEKDDEKNKTKSASPSSKPTKSKCSRPPPTGLPTQPSPTQLGGPTTTPAASLQMTVLPLSVSAFPAVFTGASLISTATTRSLNTPATTPPAVPSGTRKSGSSPQPMKTSGHPALSSHSKTALIAFGAIMGITLFGFLIFTALRCMKRRRSEASAYGDIETLYRSDHASTSMSESATISIPPNACVQRADSPPKFYLPYAFRTSQRPWSGSSFRQSQSSKATEDPAMSEAYSQPGKTWSPSMPQAVARKEVAGTGEDPFRDPELDEMESVAASTVRKFHRTPSWVDDQAARAGTAR